jgi:cellulose synthase/poly-beta-1,6-N-acetylglucosamine synthase-like glycosyltransferase
MTRRPSPYGYHNVTEDADLGIRLARAGYVTGMIEAATLEEANCELRNWFNQRSRWLKGWLRPVNDQNLSLHSNSI